MTNKNITVGILSDSHGHLDPRVKETVNRCDYIIHAGDIFNAAVLAQLQPSQKLIAVAGNNDYPAFWAAEEFDTVNALADSESLTLPGGKIYTEHGHRLGNHPDHQQLRKDHPDARLIVYGHTHHRIIDQHATPWVVNPGASGKTRTHGGPSCLILRIDGDSWSLQEHVFAESAAA